MHALYRLEARYWLIVQSLHTTGRALPPTLLSPKGHRGAQAIAVEDHFHVILILFVWGALIKHAAQHTVV